ncbi:protein kinase domain-containing protein [Polyangium jinanense]|uniref:Protein kinase n=1 Tax=Polyangium jinanense TaxID=2829994 RepID=A0A9X3X9Q1_9BACT|nr:protein kinase [Polyangium jinanense]MDC3959846.1 protein kinase [Polyangium jinanense]MDC3986297.1 protein kinase [Polyangium jinanense]
MNGSHHGRARLGPGEVVAGRFRLEELAGKGGMGEVFRARDLHTGALVALKLLYPAENGFEQAARFDREARLLSQLGHPGIVSYLAHGKAEDGRPYLVLEWLSGHDLGKRLAEGPLDVRDCVTLLLTLANALAAAHAKGILHRDIKPSNLFLRDGRVDRVTLLDFGIARSALSATVLTRPGALLGTPGYMAPEQARGEEDLRPSADVFALGCVAFHGLTGKPPFFAPSALVMLAKVLFEEVPRVELLRPGTPRALSDLIARMLEKDPSRRPEDAVALRDELVAMATRLADDVGEEARRVDFSPAAALSGDALQLLSVVVAIPGEEPPPRGETASTRAAWSSLREALRARLLRLGARVEWLASGALVVVVTPAQSAVDLATQAARCALAVHAAWPTARVALTTGRGVMKEKVLVGEAIERAFSRVAPGETPPVDGEMGGPPAVSQSGIFLDELSAKLLESRFAITFSGQTPILCEERVIEVDESRLLMGRPTPCVGRERELALLVAAIEGSIEQAEPAGALVVAPPGMGKSRLRHELLRRLRARPLEMLVLFGSGAPLSAGSPYGVLGEALRRLCEVEIGDPPDRKEEKIRQRVGRHVMPAEQRRVSEFLATMCGVGVEEPTALLRAAFRDPKIMNEQIQRAFLDLLTAECVEHPVLLVLEDLHWGDPATVKLVDAALVERRELPFFVLALARPEIVEMFPKLWQGRIVHRVRLGGLHDSAAGELVTAVLGPEVPAASVKRVVEQAAGNALFLEELIRAAAEGKAEGQPDTVLAMLQARLSCLDPACRRVLSAASVFGRTFWRGGVLTLLGRAREASSTDERLFELVEAEVLQRRTQSRFTGETEYEFRHALLRDAAYGLLTEADRVLGHRLSCAYLEQVGETDPMVLAEHARAGGDLARAADHYLRAAQQSYHQDDLDGMWTRAERGLQCGAAGELRGKLLTLELEACVWRLDWQNGVRIGKEALALLSEGSVAWNEAAASYLVIVVNRTMQNEVDMLVRVLEDVDPPPDAVASCLLLLGSITAGLGMTGSHERAARLLSRLEALSPRLPEGELLAAGHIQQARAIFAFFIEGDLWATLTRARASIELYTSACSSNWWGMSVCLSSAALAALGDIAAAERAIEDVLGSALRRNDVFLVSTARFYRMLVLAKQNAPDRRAEVEGLARLLIEQGAMEDTIAVSYGALARVFLAEGRVVEAREAAEKALGLMDYVRGWRPSIERTLILALLREGRPEEARRVADDVARWMEARGGMAGYAEIPLRLAIAEARAATGDMPAAREALAEAIRRLEWRLERIEDPVMRALHRELPEHVRLRELEREWLKG